MALLKVVVLFHPCRTRLSRSLLRRSFSEQPQRIIHNNTSPPASFQSPAQQQQQRLVQWTETILHPRRTPLGTLSPAVVRDVEQAIDVWLDTTPATMDATTTDASIVRPRHVDMAHRLLERLLFEPQQQYNGQTIIRTVLAAWLQVAHTYPHAAFAIQKAEKLCQTLQSPTVTERLALISTKQQWITEQASGGANISLVHTWTEEVANELLQRLDYASLPSANLRRTYQACLRVAVRQATHTGIVSQLLEHMEALAQAYPVECKDLPLTEAELDAVLDQLYLLPGEPTGDGTSKMEDHTLSSFEQQALQQRIVARIRAATGKDDIPRVEQLIQQWRRHCTTTTAAELQLQAFAQAVVNFYLKCQEPIRATQWMQIREQLRDDATETASSSSSWTDLLDKNTATSTTTTSSDTSDEFQELDSLNRVFVSNARERVQQKLNLLDIWATHVVESPIVPWRVTEILESLEAEDAATLGSEPYRTVLRVWRRRRDMIFPPKVLDIAVRCPEFHPELLQLQADLLHQYVRLTAETNGSEPSTVVKYASHLAVTIESRYEEILPIEDRRSLCEKVAELMPDTLGLFRFVGFLMNKDDGDNVAITQPMVDVVFRSIRNDTDTSRARRFMKLLGDNTKAETFQHGIDWYLDRGMKGRAWSLLKKAASSIGRTRNNQQPEQIGKLLSAFLAKDSAPMEDMWRRLDEVESLLQVDPETPEERRPSPLPYEFYRSLCTRFTLQRDLDQFGEWMDRLLRHNQRGFPDLHPPLDMCQSFSSVLRQEQGFASIDKRIAMIDTLSNRCQSGSARGEDIRKYMPNYFMFDHLIHDLQKYAKNLSEGATPSETHDTGDRLERTSRQATFLIETMHRLRVAPEDRHRPFVFNAAMEMVLRCDNKPMHFRAVMALKQYMTGLEVQPNRITVDHRLRACELASFPSSNRKQAFAGWKAMANALADARQLGVADVGIYHRCFEVMLANAAVEPRREEKKLKILEFVFACCCTDGALINLARDTFLQLAPKEMSERLYQQRLSRGNVVPREWKRNTKSGFKDTDHMSGAIDREQECDLIS